MRGERRGEEWMSGEEERRGGSISHSDSDIHRSYLWPQNFHITTGLRLCVFAWAVARVCAWARVFPSRTVLGFCVFACWRVGVCACVCVCVCVCACVEGRSDVLP